MIIDIQKNAIPRPSGLYNSIVPQPLRYRVPRININEQVKGKEYVEGVVAYFKLLFRHQHKGTKDNQENPH
jgi:hypothetical protein